MKRIVSLFTAFVLVVSGVYLLPAEELTSGDSVPEQAYVYEVPNYSSFDISEEALTDGEDPVIPSVGDNPSGTCGDNCTWELVNGVLTITGTGDVIANGLPYQGMTVKEIIVSEGIQVLVIMHFKIGLESHVLSFRTAWRLSGIWYSKAALI